MITEFVFQTLKRQASNLPFSRKSNHKKKKSVV